MKFYALLQLRPRGSRRLESGSTRAGVLIAGCLLLLCGFRTFAQPYSIDWFTIDGGGGTSTNGQYRLSGSIGQPDAGGQMVSGNYSVTGGFWALVALNTPGVPALRIFLTSTNTAVVEWPSPSTGFNLQQNADLQNTSWSGPSETINDNGTNKFIIVNSPAGNRFYRLKAP